MPDKQKRVAKPLHNITDNKNYPATSVCETITNGFFTVDNKWVVKYWNPAAEKILNVKAADIVGKNLWLKFEGIIPVELFAIDQRAFLTDMPVHFHEYWGEMNAWFDVITYHCDNMLSVSFKSSKHKHIEHPETAVEQLKILTQLYRFVTEITNDSLWEWNLFTHEIFWIDGGHKRVFGYQVENALIPQSFWENSIHPDDKEFILASLKKIIAKKSECLWEATYRFKAANGNYLFVKDRGQILRDESGKATRIIGATQNITEKKLLEIKLASERLNRQNQITAAILKQQENERTTIALTLNENMSQLLAAAKWNIQLAKSYGNKRDDCLQLSSEYLDQVIAGIRQIYKTLFVHDQQITGLFDNIKNLVADTNKANIVQFKFYKTGIDEEEDLDKNLQLDIFRMVQELVNNIIKHAHATTAKINLYRAGSNLVLCVNDNGAGKNKRIPKKGVGIINITSRAALYGGTVAVDSKPGKGYTLTVILPCFSSAY